MGFASEITILMVSWKLTSFLKKEFQNRNHIQLKEKG